MLIARVSFLRAADTMAPTIMMNLLLAIFLLGQGTSPPSQTGVVEGRVLGLNGSPAAGVRVMAQALPETGAFSSEPSVMASIVQTDTAGHFRLERIPPGRYYITAGLVEFPTYYPGVKAIADAKVVVVAGGAYLSGIDFSLSRPVLKVSGRVIREGNPPVAPTQRVLITGGVLLTGGRLVSQHAVIPTDGSFEFVNLPPGIYTI